MRAALLALALTTATPACAPPTYVQPTTCASCPSPRLSGYPGRDFEFHHYLLMLALTIIICVAVL